MDDLKLFNKSDNKLEVILVNSKEIHWWYNQGVCSKQMF